MDAKQQQDEIDVAAEEDLDNEASEYLYRRQEASPVFDWSSLAAASPPPSKGRGGNKTRGGRKRRGQKGKHKTPSANPLLKIQENEIAELQALYGSQLQPGRPTHTQSVLSLH